MQTSTGLDRIEGSTTGPIEMRKTRHKTKKEVHTDAQNNYPLRPLCAGVAGNCQLQNRNQLGWQQAGRPTRGTRMKVHKAFALVSLLTNGPFAAQRFTTLMPDGLPQDHHDERHRANSCIDPK
jgi:hypothetical protein